MGQTETNCPNCGHDLAYFFQMQTRSADEASTLFFKCKNHREKNVKNRNVYFAPRGNRKKQG